MRLTRPSVHTACAVLGERGPHAVLCLLCPQAVAARETIVRTCANLLRKVREADVAQPGGVPSAKPAKRGVLPGSFLHHLAHARHHPTFREGALLTDAEIISQVRWRPHILFILFATAAADVARGMQGSTAAGTLL